MSILLFRFLTIQSYRLQMNMKPTNNRHARAKTSRATKPNRSKVADRAKNCPAVVVRKYTAEAQRIRR